VVLADPNHPPAPRVHHAVGITQSPRPSRIRSDCNGLPSELLTVEALVRVVAEINDAAADEVGAAAIFMDAGPHAERRLAGTCCRRSDVGRGAIGGAADDHRSPIFLRARLQPIDFGAVEQDAAEPDRRRDDEFGSNR